MEFYIYTVNFFLQKNWIINYHYNGDKTLRDIFFKFYILCIISALEILYNLCKYMIERVYLLGQFSFLLHKLFFTKEIAEVIDKLRRSLMKRS